MSWSARFEVEHGEVIELTVFESNVAVGYHADQYEQSLETVWKFLRSGVLGDTQGRYSVILSGHGNPEHKPKSGWSDDFVSISISQLRPTS